MMKKFTILLISFLWSTIQLTGQLSILPQHEYEQYHIEHILINHNKIFSSSDTKSKKQVALEIFGDEKQLILSPVDVMSPELVQAYPTIGAYKARTKDGEIYGRITTHTNGIFVQLNTPKGFVTINPVTYKADQIHKVEIGHNPNIQIPPCQLIKESHPLTHKPKEYTYKKNSISNGSIKRTYTMAITTPYEFYELVGESEESNIAGIVAAVNALEEVYENELAVNFTLLPPIIFTNEDDPYNQDDPDFDQVFQNEILNNYDIDDFDIAHFLGPANGYDEGGYALLRALCSPTKTYGYSGGYNGIYFQYVFVFSHEVGHQFGANHSWNGSGGGCTMQNHSGPTAVELGSGSTIMSYNGLCSLGQNTNEANSHFFHSNSVKEILQHIRESSTNCSQLIETDSSNEAPIVNVGECGIVETTIPQSTPFMLKGASSDDKDADKLTYSWEQVDAGFPTGHGLIGDEASMSVRAPLFETFNPSISTTRFFPEINYTLGNKSNDFQVLPAVKREMNFNMITRDNEEGAGGMGIDGVTIQVSEFGPFTLDSLSNTNLKIDDELEVYWSTNGTDDLCDNLAIYFSLDNGLSFDFKLASGIPYADGKATVVIPHNVPRSTFNLFMLACDDYDCIRFYDLYDGPVRVSTTCPIKPSELCDPSPKSFEQGSNELDLNLEILIGNNIIISSSSSCKAPAYLGSTLGYTFIAVDQSNDVIKGIAEFGDFRTLQAGNYHV